MRRSRESAISTTNGAEYGAVGWSSRANEELVRSDFPHSLRYQYQFLNDLRFWTVWTGEFGRDTSERWVSRIFPNADVSRFEDFTIRGILATLSNHAFPTTHFEYDNAISTWIPFDKLPYLRKSQQIHSPKHCQPLKSR